MSTPESIGLGGSAPVVNEAFEPQSVRDGSAATKQAYAAALDFESLLVNQLAKQLTASTGFMGQDDGSSDGSSGSDPASGELASLLPGALTSAIMSDGGLGVAAGLMSSLDPQSAGASAAPAADGGSAR